MRYIQPENRSQCVMLNTLEDLVPTDHPVRLLDLVVEQMVAANPEQFDLGLGDSDPGRPPYAPHTMLKLFLYGYLTNIRASRKLETETKRNLELIWLLGRLSPDHWSIAKYRREHGDHIKTATTLFRQFLRDHGYIHGACVAVDGTKIKANARRDMWTAERLEQRLAHFDDQLAEYLAQLAANDLRDDLAEELETLDSAVPVDRHLVDKIIALQQQIEQLTAHKETLARSGQTYVSPTDPDAALMKTGEGKVPGYNVQSVVDDAYHMIAATDVLTAQEDHAALPVMVQSLHDELNLAPAIIIADTGYYTPDLIQQVETNTQATCYIPPPQQEADPITFAYNASTDSYTCSAGHPLVLHSRNKRQRHSRADVYRGTQCATCPLRPQCTTSPHGRLVHRYHNQVWRDAYRARMKTKSSQALVALRKTLVEHVFGTIKLMGGKIPLLLRGKLKVATEVNLYATAYNFKRLLTCTSWDDLTAQIASHSWQLA